LVHSVADHDDGIAGVLSLGTFEAAQLCAVTGNTDDHSDYAIAKHLSDARRAHFRSTDERTRTGHLAQYAAAAECGHGTGATARCGRRTAHSVPCPQYSFGAYIEEPVGDGLDAQLGAAVAELDTDASCASDVADGE